MAVTLCPLCAGVRQARLVFVADDALPIHKLGC
jgi:hypothetical protein